MNPLLFIKPLLSLGGGLLSNPITKIVAEKTVGAIQHKMEKEKIIKAKEIEAAKEIDVAKIGVQLEQVKQQSNSWKDEWLVLFFSAIFLMHFLPWTQELMTRGWEIIGQANDYFWIILLTIVGGSFGVTTLNKFKK
jgi:hypothetical protein|tara:strand:+ start:1903 stop:2310 length:408 start_codon:yes stop_codon:yes gene_type:complete